MKASDLELIREKLLARRDALFGDRGRSLRRMQESTCDAAADPIDRAAGNCDFDVAVGQAHLEGEEWTAVVEALEKIAEGSFGLCEACDGPIAEKRLLALPSARYCLDCQKVLESERNDMLRA